MKMYGGRDQKNKEIRREIAIPENVDGVLLEPFGAHNAITDKKYYFSREDRIRKFGMASTRKYSYGVNIWDPKQMKKMSALQKQRTKAKFKKQKAKLIKKMKALKKKAQVSIKKWKPPKKKKLKLPFMKHRFGHSGLKDRMSTRRFKENLHEGIYPQRGTHKFNKEDWKFKIHKTEYHTVAARMKAIRKRRANEAKRLAEARKKAAAKAKAKAHAKKNAGKKKKKTNPSGLSKPRVLESDPNEIKLSGVIDRMSAKKALDTHNIINSGDSAPKERNLSARFSGSGPERLLSAQKVNTSKPKSKPKPKSKKMKKGQGKVSQDAKKKPKAKKPKKKKKKNIFAVLDKLTNKVKHQIYKDVISQPLEHAPKKSAKKKNPHAPTPPASILIELPNEIFDKSEARSKIMSFVHEFEKEGLDPLWQLDHVNFKYNTTSLIAKRFALPEQIDRRVMEVYVALNKKRLKEFNGDFERVDLEDFDSVDEKLRDAKDLMKVRSVLIKTGEDPLKVAQLSMEIRKIEAMAREAEARNKIVKKEMRRRLNRKGHTDINKNKFPDYHHHFDLYYNDTFHGIEEMFANIFGS